MSVESELRNNLEEYGFTQKKKVKSFDWSYTHPIYMVVVYRANHIFFNYLAKYMRDEVKKMRGTIMDLDKKQKEELYRNVLSRLDYYKVIKNNLKFSFRQSGGDFVGISENVGFNVLNEILLSIISSSGTGVLTNQSPKAATIPEIEIYLPTKADVEQAINQIHSNVDGDFEIDAILNQVEKNAIADGKMLKSNWREITEMNFAFWFK